MSGGVCAIVWPPMVEITAGCREPQAVGHEAAGCGGKGKVEGWGGDLW